MAEHHDEMEQIEALKRWWLENRAFVIAGVVIGVAAVAGWRGWEWHQTRQAEQASALYDQVGDALEAKDLGKAQDLVGQLMEGYGRTPYATNAALLKAKADVDAGDHGSARTMLDWVVTNGVDAELKALARIRLARVHLADANPELALGLLDGVPSGAFTALVEDVRGDAQLALGKPEEARRAWQAALDAGDGNLADRALIELKLAALGPAPAAATAPAAAPATAAATAPATGTKP